MIDPSDAIGLAAFISQFGQSGHELDWFASLIDGMGIWGESALLNKTSWIMWDGGNQEENRDYYQGCVEAPVSGFVHIRRRNGEFDANYADVLYWHHGAHFGFTDIVDMDIVAYRVVSEPPPPTPPVDEWADYKNLARERGLVCSWQSRPDPDGGDGVEGYCLVPIKNTCGLIAFGPHDTLSQAYSALMKSEMSKLKAELAGIG